jgi:hypothetical protein
MLLLDAAGSEPSVKDLSSLLGNFQSAAAEALSPGRLAVRYAQIEDLTKKTTKNISGMFGASADALQRGSVAAFMETIKIGASYEDVLSIQQEIATQQQKALSLTEAEVIAAVEFSKATGVAAKDVGSIVLAFADLGQSTSTALESMSGMAAEARKYGLNVGQFMQTVAKNLTLVNAYGFKNGVEGFTKMVARAQALRIDMTQTTKLAEKLLNPEDAIELAANFQMLGGAIGDLGDPFKLMYMAQNDMEGLQEAVVQAAKSSVMFNKETGSFKISGTEMYRLRAQAQALGISYEELANTAVKAAKETEILSRIRFSGLDEETQQLVANLGEIKDGQVQIKLPTMDKVITDFSKLQDKNSDEFKALEEYQKTNQLSDRQIAEGQLSVLQKIENSLSGLKNLTVAQPQFQELGKAAAESFQKSFEEASKKVKGVAVSPEYQSALSSTTDAITSGFKDVLTELEKGNFAGATKAIADMGAKLADTTGVADLFNKAVKGMTTRLREGLLPNPIRDGEDVLMGPSKNTVLSAPQGTFKLNEKDTVIAGTKLFEPSRVEKLESVNTKDERGSQSQIQKLEFANAAEVKVGGSIQINGIQPGIIGDMLLRDPDFQSGIKNLFSKNFKEQLGTA